MNLSNLILNALLKDAQAQEAKAITILQNYFENSAGIGEHPDIIGAIEGELENAMIPPAPTGETEDGQ